MKEHKVLELVSMETALQVASKDAPDQSTHKSYPKDNQLTYYILINTWLYLWKNYAVHAWYRLLGVITQEGLIPAINEMQEEAMRIIKGEPLGPWAQILYSEIRSGEPMIERDLLIDSIGTDDDATVLFLLRYPKRFSPVNNDIIQDATLKDFLQYENRTKLLQRSESFGYTWCVNLVKARVEEMYDWDSIVDEIDKLKETDIIFSSGSARDAGPSLGEKVKAIVNDGNHSDYIQPIFGVYTLNRYAAHREHPTCSSVRAVPKSYKSSRIIAMERTFPIAKGKAIEYIFRRHDMKCHTGINLEDQGINQYYAQLGSCEGTVATLDASHASDLISKSLFIDLFPSTYVSRVKGLLPDYCEVAGGKRPLQMASTSGHTLTFRHETIVYKAIAEAAVQLVTDLGIPVQFPCAIAYGDDTLVSTEAYDAALYLFARLGLVINTDKSYSEGRYRESCGKDYIDGVDVSSVYYPRFPVLGTIHGDSISLSGKTYNDDYRGKLDNALTMLIDLQKKLYPYTYSGSQFVASIVRTAYPSITSSVRGTVCNDLWDCIDTGKIYDPTAWKLELSGNRYPRVRTFAKIGKAKDMLHGSASIQFQRLSDLDRIHIHPVVSYNSPEKFSEEDVAVYEYWRYTTFLREGPQYEDELLRLLKVSSRPMTIEEFYGKRTLKLKKTR